MNGSPAADPLLGDGEGDLVNMEVENQAQPRPSPRINRRRGNNNPPRVEWDAQQESALQAFAVLVGNDPTPAERAMMASLLTRPEDAAEVTADQVQAYFQELEPEDRVSGGRIVNGKFWFLQHGDDFCHALFAIKQYYGAEQTSLSRLFGCSKRQVQVKWQNLRSRMRD